MSKKYGLILPKSKTKITNKKLVPKLKVFDNDSDSGDDSESKKREVNAEIHKAAMKNIMKKQTQLQMQKALEEDPTVYDYDEIYDDMKSKQQAKLPEDIVKANKRKEPKYIKNILKAAELRKFEQERREERMIQREREKEGNEFNDKPQFVTTAYKEKLKAQEALKEEEKRQDAIEAALDVRKQKDLSGFYRNFLNQQMGETKIRKNTDTTIESKDDQNKATSEDSNDDEKVNEDEDLELSSDSSPSENESSSEDNPKDKRPLSKTNEKSRKTKRHSTSSSSDAENESTKKKESSSSSKHSADNNDLNKKQITEKKDVNKIEKNDSKNESVTNQSKYSKRNNQDTILSARERYLARKNAAKSAPIIASDSD